jgi:hypothetical protein
VTEVLSKGLMTTSMTSESPVRPLGASLFGEMVQSDLPVNLAGIETAA